MVKTKTTKWDGGQPTRSSARLKGRGNATVRKETEERDEALKVWIENSDDDEAVAAKKVVLRSKGRSHQQVENDVFEESSRKARERIRAMKARREADVSEEEKSQDDAVSVINLASSEDGGSPVDGGKLDGVSDQKSLSASEEKLLRSAGSGKKDGADGSGRDDAEQIPQRVDAADKRARETNEAVEESSADDDEEAGGEKDTKVHGVSDSDDEEPDQEDRYKAAKKYLKDRLDRQGPVKVSMRKWAGKLSEHVGTRRIRLAKDFAERNLKDNMLQMVDGVYPKGFQSMSAFELMEVYRQFKGWDTDEFEWHRFILRQSSAADMRKTMSLEWNSKSGKEEFRKFSGGKDWSESFYAKKTKVQSRSSQLEDAVIEEGSLSSVDEISCKLIQFSMDEGKLIESISESAAEACRRSPPIGTEKGSRRDFRCKSDMQVFLDQFEAAGLVMSKIEHDVSAVELCQMEMSGAIESGEWQKDHALFMIVFNQNEAAKVGAVNEASGSVFHVGEDEHLLNRWGSWNEFKHDLSLGCAKNDSAVSVIYASMLKRNLLVVTCYGLRKVTFDIVKIKDAPNDEVLVLLRHTGRSSMGRFRKKSSAGGADQSQQFRMPPDKSGGSEDRDSARDRDGSAKKSGKKRGRDLELDASITGTDTLSKGVSKAAGTVSKGVVKKKSSAKENERVRRLLESLASDDGSCSRTDSQDASCNSKAKARKVDLDQLEQLAAGGSRNTGSEEYSASASGTQVGSAVGQRFFSEKKSSAVSRVMFNLDDVQENVFSASGELDTQALLESNAVRGDVSVFVTDVGDVMNMRSLFEGLSGLPVAIPGGQRLQPEDRGHLFNLVALATHANREDREAKISKEGVVVVVSTARKFKGEWGKWTLTAGDGSGLTWFAHVRHSEIGFANGALSPESMEYHELTGAHLSNVQAVGIHAKAFESHNSSMHRGKMIKACVGIPIEYNDECEGIVKRQSLNTKKFMPARYRFDSVSPTKAVCKQVVIPMLEALGEKMVRYISSWVDSGKVDKAQYPDDAPKLLVFNLFDPVGKIARTIEEIDINLPVGSGVDAISDRPLAVREEAAGEVSYTMQAAYAQNYGVGISKTMQRVKAWQSMVVGYPQTVLAQNKLFRLAEQLGSKLTSMVIFCHAVAGNVVPPCMEIVGGVKLPGGCFYTVGSDFPTPDTLSMLVMVRKEFVGVAKSLEVKVSPLSESKLQAKKFLKALHEEEADQAANRGAVRKSLLTEDVTRAGNELWLKKPASSGKVQAVAPQSEAEDAAVNTSWNKCDRPSEGGWGQPSPAQLAAKEEVRKMVAKLSARAMEAIEQVYKLEKDIRKCEEDSVGLENDTDAARDALQEFCDDNSGNAYGYDSTAERDILIGRVGDCDQAFHNNSVHIANLKETRQAYKVIARSCIDRIDSSDCSVAARKLVEEVKQSSVYACEPDEHSQNQVRSSEGGKECGLLGSAVGHELSDSATWMGDQGGCSGDELCRTKRMRAPATSSEFVRNSSLRVPRSGANQFDMPNCQEPPWRKGEPREDPFDDGPVHINSEVAGPSFVTPVRPTGGQSVLPVQPVRLQDLVFNWSNAVNEGRIMVRFAAERMELLLRMDLCAIHGVAPEIEGRSWDAHLSSQSLLHLSGDLQDAEKIGFMVGTYKSDGSAIEQMNKTCVGKFWLLCPVDCDSNERIILFTAPDGEASMRGFSSVHPIHRRRLCFATYRTAKRSKRVKL